MNLSFVGSLNPAGNPISVFVDDLNLYVAAESGGCHIYDLTDPAEPSYVSTYTSTGNVLDVSADGSYAFIADSEDDVVIINVFDPTTPFYVSEYALDDDNSDIYFDSTYLEGPVSTGQYTFSFIATDADGTETVT